MTLKDLRIAKKMTQNELASALGIPYNTYRQYEYGTTRPSVGTLKEMSNLFNISIDDLSDMFITRKIEADSVEATAKRWGVGINRVRKWCQSEKIEGAYLDNRWHIPLDAKMPSGGGVKNQHYVFRKYLAAWADKDSTSSGRIYVYRKAPKGTQPATEKALLTKVASQKYYYDISGYTEKDIAILNKTIQYMQKNQRISFTINEDLLADEALARDFIEKYFLCPVEQLEEQHHFYERLRKGDYSFYKDSVPVEALKKLKKMIIESLFDQINRGKDAIAIADNASEHIYDPDTKHDFLLFFFTQYLRTPKIRNAQAAVFEEYKAAAGLMDADTNFHVNLFLVFAAGVLSNNVNDRYDSFILLLENKTDVPFITADTPILNLIEDDKRMQMYYPLSPDMAMILFCGYDQQPNGTIEITDAALINSLNDKIMENAVNEVYSSHPLTASER